MTDTVIKISAVTIAISLTVLAGTNAYTTFSKPTSAPMQNEQLASITFSQNTNDCATKLENLISAQDLVSNTLKNTPEKITTKNKFGNPITKYNQRHLDLALEEITLTSNIDRLKKSCDV